MGLPPSTGLSPEAIAALAIKVEVTDLECPPEQPDFPQERTDVYFRWFYCFFRDRKFPKILSGIAASIAVAPMMAIVPLTHLLAVLLPPFVQTIALPILTVLDEVRKDIDVDLAQLSALVLNELLGTEFSPEMVPTGRNIDSHIARAEAIGGLLHKQLISEFVGKQDITEDLGRRAAARMSGLLINFGAATGLLGVIGGLVPQLRLEELREVGELVARNLGLGRLHRMVMKPIFTTLIATPYQWYLNRTVHPKRFTAAEAINAFTGVLIDEKDLFADLELEGWSADRIKQLIRLHQKKLEKTQVELLVRYKAWTRTLGIDYLKRIGWSAENADLVLNTAELERADRRLTAFIDALEKDVLDGLLTIPEMETVLDALPLGDVEKAFISSTVSYKLKIPRAQITLAQMESAFEQGLVDLNELEAYLRRRGYSNDDGRILTQLTLLKTAQLKDKGKAKADRQERKKATETAIAARAAKKKRPA